MTTGLDVLASLSKLFSGDKSTITTSGGSRTVTESTDIDQETVNKLLQSALESNAGLAQVSQGQRAAGLYNSSTNRLMTNDLLSRLTAQVAASTASKTQTSTSTPTKQVTQGAGLNQSDSLTKLVAGLSAFQKLGGIKGLKESYKDLTDMFSGGVQDTPFLSNIAEAGFSSFSGGGGFQDFAGGGMSVAPSAQFSPADYSFLNSALSGPAADFSTFSPTVIDESNYTTNLDTSQIDLSNSGAGADNGNFFNASSRTGDFTPPASGGATPSAGTTVISGLTAPTINAWGAGMAGLGLISGIQGLTDGTGSNDLLSAIGVGTSGYQLYKAANALANGGSLSFSAPAAGASTSTIDQVLPYAGSVISAAQGDYQSAALQAVGTYIGGSIGGPVGGAIGEFLGGAVSSIFGGSAEDPHDNADTTLYILGVSKSGAYGLQDAEFGDSNPELTAKVTARAKALRDEYDKLNAPVELIANDEAGTRYRVPASQVFAGSKALSKLRGNARDPFTDQALGEFGGATALYDPVYAVYGQTSGSGRWEDQYALEKSTIDAFNQYSSRIYDQATHYADAFGIDSDSVLGGVKTQGAYSTLQAALDAYRDQLFSAVKSNAGAFTPYL